MTPIEERTKLWRDLVDHPKYKYFNLVLEELRFRTHHKRNWKPQSLEDMSSFYI